MTRQALIRGSTAQEIAGSVRDALIRGQLRSGQSLPPVRVLAEHLGVNRNTVHLAYRQLAAAGVATTRRGGGTVLGPPPAPDAREGVDPDPGARAGGTVDLSSGNPDPLLLPDLTAALGAAAAAPSTLYGAAPTDPYLERVVRRRLARDGLGGCALVVTHGAVDAIERVLACHLIRGDIVAVEQPCFLSSINLLRLNGYRTHPVEVDHAGMRPDSLAEALRSGARAVIITSRAHNPTGASITTARAAELERVIAAHPEVLVIEDDHFSALSRHRYSRATPTSTTRWALVRSVAKFLGPDLRLAVVATDATTADVLDRRLGGSAGWVSHLLQRAVAHLLTDAGITGVLRRAKRTYADRSDALRTALDGNGIVSYPSDGLNVWIPLARDSAPIVSALGAAGWAVRPGERFTQDTDTLSHGLRVTTAQLEPVAARELAGTLAAIMRELHYR